MTTSLPIAGRPPDAQNEPVTLPPARGPLETHNTQFDEARWDAWVIKGRRADARLAEKARMLAVLGVTIGMAAGTLWILFG